MASDYAADRQREHVIEQLQKLRSRLHGKQLVMPGDGCPSVDFHLAGLFLKEHVDLFINAVKRLSE